MTVDMQPTRQRRMPAAVLTAAILFGFFGTLFGLGLLLFGQLGTIAGTAQTRAALPFTLLGVLITICAIAGAIGMAKGYRGGQILVVSLSVMWVLVSLYTLGQGNPASFIGLLVGGAICLLATVPVSSREWFAR